MVMVFWSCASVVAGVDVVSLYVVVSPDAVCWPLYVAMSLDAVSQLV